MGAATARALVLSGRRTLLLEQFHLGHKRGSSHGASRIFRFSYPDETYVRMAQEALPLWRELEAETGSELLTVTGGFDAGAHIFENERALKACDVETEMLDGAEAMKRFPVVSFPPDEPILFQPNSGFVRADRAIAAFVGSATHHGADVVEATRALEVSDEDGNVTVTTTDGEWRAGVAVVTAGAWAKTLLATAGIDLPVRPTRETIAYFRLDATPPTLVEWGDPSSYSLPHPGIGIKAGQHGAGPGTDPDDEGAVNEASVKTITKWMAERFPGIEPEPVHAETCLYTNTSDERFIVERHGSIVVGSPCSGHGFKFAPLIGQRLAALAAEAL